MGRGILPVLASALLVSNVALAAQPTDRPYIGVGWAEAEIDDFCSDGASLGFSGQCDDDDETWKLIVGNRINEYIGWELNLLRNAEATFNGTLLGVPISGEVELDSIVSITAVGTLPLGDYFHLFAKGGAYYWDVNVSASALGMTLSESDNGWDGTVGLGGAVHFTPNIGLRAEWERFFDVGDNDSSTGTDVDVYSVSLMYTF